MINSKEILNTKFLLYIIFFPGLFSLVPKPIYYLLWGLLLITIFVYNKIRLKDLNIIFLITCIFIINFLLFPQKKIIIFLYISFLFKCYPLYFICSKKINKDYFINLGYKLALISNIFIFFENLIIKSSGYMAFGYHLLPVIIIYIYFFIKYKKYLTLLLIAINSFLLIIYGNRGASLSLIIFLILSYFIFNKNKYTKILMIFLSSNFLLVSFIYKNTIKNFLINISLFFLKELNIRSYFLSKLILFLNKGLASSSSGRNIIYSNAIELGNQNWLLGNGIGKFRYIYETYPHNIFLEIYVQFGSLGIIILCYFFYKVLYLLLKDKINKELLLLLFILAIPRLILSSSFWERPEFWGLIGCIRHFNILRKGKNEKKHIIKKCDI